MPTDQRQLRALLVAGLSACLLALAAPGAGAKTASEKLEAVEGKIGAAQRREGVLTTEIAALGARISGLEDEVAGLRRRETVVEAELARKQAELDGAEARLRRALDRLGVMREHLRRALLALRERLVAIYMEGTPDPASLVLAAEDYGDLVSTAYYLDALRHSDERLAERVRDLRDEAKRLVRVRREAKLTIEAARDAITAREQRLESTRTALQARQGSLAAARGARRASLARVRGQIAHHEEVAGELQLEIQRQLAATTGATFPGPLPTPSEAGLIWPVDGVLSSTFGMRWGRMHEGIDIGAAEGTPIRAAANGTVVLVQSEASSGGYGNFTCIDHGGGLSTCYAHQSSVATSAGASVAQGQTIGYVGNTGHSFGAHLHFEVRFNGAPTDPLAYL